MRCILLLVLGLVFVWHSQLVTARRPCTATSNTTIVHDALAEQARLGPRAASALRAGLAQPWPQLVRNGQQLRVIRYCYATKLYRDYLHCSKFNPALKLWADKLGHPASAQSGHAVAWEEANDGGAPGKRKRRYCYSTYEHGKGGTWNKNVPIDTLAIFLDPTFDGARATTGYDAASTDEGRHQMVLGVDSDPVEIAHELGHVLGMSHEHIRSDRDAHVLYTCTSVLGYADALSRAMATESLSAEAAHQRLCDDRAFAQKYDFAGSQFTKNPHGRVHDEPGGFDAKSIMLYDSDVFAGEGAPLVLLGGGRIERNVEPSVGDVAWVKLWYPWVGGGPSGS
ncbi:hypothetical protein C7974DRAFT_414198 [Boeremia exigua]|uniref:uncharacterized protein n=1 Tax=Boeremia exigua TaxID=749465 RepID=UPI001E8E80DE|nr:uncharacterized protein C7974DRAFT_414198 [Boeremia exigua]KAH6625703.1 hypothetical protein C7974DRAFT_414198 [Boeremia exigua]